MRSLPDSLLDRPVDGLNLARPGTGADPRLRDQLGDGPTVLAFLRHLG